MKSDIDEKRLNNLEISTTNRLLLALSETELNQLLPKMKNVSLARGEVLYESGEHIKYAYFLNENTLASVNFTMENGAGIETIFGRLRRNGEHYDILKTRCLSGSNRCPICRKCNADSCRNAAS